MVLKGTENHSSWPELSGDSIALLLLALMLRSNIISRPKLQTYVCTERSIISIIGDHLELWLSSSHEEAELVSRQ